MTDKNIGQLEQEAREWERRAGEFRKEWWSKHHKEYTESGATPRMIEVAFAADFAAQEVEREREKCCKDVCLHCAGKDEQIGKVLPPDGDSTWRHIGHARQYPCYAAAIRERSRG